MNDQARSLLAAAREGLAPDAAVMARVRARVAASVAPAAPSPRVGPSAIVKLGALLVVAGGVAVGVHRSAAAHAVSAPQVTAPAAHEQTAEPSIATASHEPPARVVAPRVRAPEPVSLSREVELIDQAMLSLRAHDPDAALTVLRTFDHETLGRAQMAEEAAAIDIEARCALDEDVGDRLDAFDRAWPESAERSRILAACR